MNVYLWCIFCIGLQTNMADLTNVYLRVVCFEYKLALFVLQKLNTHTYACMNNKGFFLQLKYTRVKLHANACNYRISKFCMRVITRTCTLHAPYTQCPCSDQAVSTQTTRILRVCRCCNPFDWYYTFILIV